MAPILEHFCPLSMLFAQMARSLLFCPDGIVYCPDSLLFCLDDPFFCPDALLFCPDALLLQVILPRYPFVLPRCLFQVYFAQMPIYFAQMPIYLAQMPPVLPTFVHFYPPPPPPDLPPHYIPLPTGSCCDELGVLLLPLPLPVFSWSVVLADGAETPSSSKSSSPAANSMD